MRLILAAVIAALPLCSQRLHVYSPLTRVDPTGAIVKQDRGKAPPRHILSPGVPRNGFSSFRVVVELNRPGPYFLDIGQNPENAVKATLYRENFVETAAGHIPDSLSMVSIPYQGFATDFRLPGQKVVTFWLDMWVDRDAPVDRVKVEPQLYAESVKDWIVYPMEVRVQQPVIPPDARILQLPPLPPPSAPSDTIVHAFVQRLLCGAAPGKQAPDAAGQITARHLLRRNVAQHMVIAPSRDEARALWTKATSLVDAAAWCRNPVTPEVGPEWYLRFRDGIYRAAGASD